MTSPTPAAPATSRGLTVARLAAGALGLVLVGMSLSGLSGAAGVAGPTSDGSDWGTQGLLSSDSGVAGRWDNVGNPDSGLVPRNQTQVIAHTDDKNYFDIDNATLDAYADHFGAGNGHGGLEVSLSQSTDLTNQAITVSFAGADPDLPTDGSDSRSYFQVFQCWGAMGADGRPDPAAADPDPATCQVGASGPDSIGGSAKREYRVVAGDPLLPGGDWEQYDDTSSLVEVPFLSIQGEESGPNLSLDNAFFNKTTTNELSHVVLPASATTQRQFEVQTGTESQGLGCGRRTDDVSTSTCWLVVVPRIQGVLENLGPTAPSVWAQRMQFQLGFRDVVTACAKGSSRSLLGGSEMLADAAASWIPGACDSAGVALGYTRLGEQVARNQYVGGSSDAVLVSEPVPSRAPAVHVPIALTAPVFAFNLDYRPVCDGDEGRLLTSIRTDAGAQACGYADLQDLKADIARAGQPVRDLRLDARLVAKMLTQSYQNSMINCAPTCTFAVSNGTMPQWSAQRPTSLTDDPEFRDLNPQLHLPRQSAISEFVLEAARSDAAAQVWRWVLADPAAASFLAGCPDRDGVVVNPFYSTRTYTGCSADAATLGAAADQAREDTDTPDGFVDSALTYPPDGSPFPLPNWQEEPATTSRPARTLVDHLPRVDFMQVGARDAFVGYKPRNSEFCSYDVDPTCFPPPGKWKDPKTLQPFGQRRVFTITDTPSAARFKLPTAQLCDAGGTACVGASSTTLRSAADRFTAAAAAGVRSPATTPDYAGGAYPLTLPVYAAVRPTLPQASREAYADAFAYLVGAGQVPGYLPGNLPPGYAPLTATLETDASAAITQLRAADPKASSSAKPSKSPTASASASESPSASESTGGGGENPTLPTGGAPPSADVPTDAVLPAASPSAVPTEVQTLPASASTESWPSYLLPLGLLVTLAAGAAGPWMRRRTSLRLR